MRAERWQQIEDLYHAALERAPSERSTFIAEACDGDEELRREVESLLASHDGASQFIEEPAAEAAARLIADDKATARVGQQIGHYKIVQLIGEGGMGEVYLAEDARLGRRVALKLLPSRFTTDGAGLRRFQQEACAASALNHPNILTIYEVGQSDSAHFIATEFIDGVTLRKRMAGAPPELNEVLEVASQVASALSAAHASGIVHRDVKPENIMLRRDGYVKVLDFGLAKLTEQQAASPEAPTLVRSEPGLVMGTVSYMSPEQARGAGVDARTDIWSLGCVVYEMMAGRTPFAGETMSEVLAAILGDKEPPPLSRYAREVPPELERIVTKALTRNREERYQTAKDLLVDLKRLKQRLQVEAEIERTGTPQLGAGTTQTSGGRVGVETDRQLAAIPTSSVEYLVSEMKHHRRGALLALAALVVVAAGAYLYFSRSGKTAISSIAVLPFTNVSGDPGMEYLSDGVSESLINSLSELPGLKVIARGSAFRYKGKEVEPQEVAQALGVQAIVTGRVVQRGDQLQISAELVDARDKTQMWGEQFNRKATDLLQVQAEISQRIAEKLRLRLTSAEQKQLVKGAKANPQAYEVALKGRFEARKSTPEGFKKSVEYYNQAIAIDPNYALAYSLLAGSYRSLGANGFLDPKEAMPKAEAAARKALELDESLAEAHSVIGAIKMHSWDWAGAERELKRAIELNPNLTGARAVYATYLSIMGQHEQAIAEAKQARELDPLRPLPNANIGYALYFARQYDQAIEQLKKTLELDQNFGFAHLILGYAYAGKAQYAQAIAEYKEAIRLGRDGTSERCYLGVALAKAGQRDEAEAILKQLETTNEYVSPAELALLHVALGEKEKALSALERAYAAHDLQMQYLGIDPGYDSLRSDPRFADFLRRVGLPQ